VPDTNQGNKMELFERVKAIMFNPKEEWIIIEDENTPLVKVFVGYLLILALIPAVAIFFNFWWNWHSAYSEAIAKISGNYPNIAEITARIKAQYPFDPKLGIINAVKMLVIILGGAYISAAVINAFSDQYGSSKDLNRTFSLVAYSLTPMCVAGILYIYSPLSSIVQYVGLYGLYPLYTGIEPQLKPAANKKNLCFIISLLVVVAVWVILSKIVQEISVSILAEMAKSNAGNMLKDF